MVGWKMEDGRWRIEDEGWKIEDGAWKMEVVFMTAALNDDIINNVTTTQISPELIIINIDI